MGLGRNNYGDNDGKEPLLGNLIRDVNETSKCKSLKLLSDKSKRLLNDFKEFARKAWEMGRSDPRKFVFAIKMGLALAIVSLLIFWKGVNEDFTQYSIWAILTVIVMFEFSIGATLIKGFNRVLGTICAGVLAFSFAELSYMVGRGEDVVIVTSIFITGSCATYLKLYPSMKPYEYGFRVFILTYCILMVAGYRTKEYGEAVITRLVLIAVGAGVCFVVNVFIFPIWAGDALHSLVVENFKAVASSLEGCVNGYLKCVEYERLPSKILLFQAYDDPLYNGYRSVVESSTKEDTLLGFAIWEPPHGRFRMFNYPWKNYANVNGALRHCAFTVMALHGCILSEIQAPAERRQVFGDELQKVGAEGAKVLRELGSRVDKMEKLGPEDILKRVHKAAEQLQKKIDQMSHLLVNSKSWGIAIQQPEKLQHSESHSDTNENLKLGSKSLSETVLDLRSLTDEQPATWPLCLSFNADADAKADKCRTESASALSLATFASLLIEFVARLQNVVHSFEELSEKAEFAEPITEYAIANKKVGFCIRVLRCLGF